MMGGQGVTPYVSVIDRTRQRDGFFSRDAFTYDREVNAYSCPANKPLSYMGIVHTSRARRHSPCRRGRARPGPRPRRNRGLHPRETTAKAHRARVRPPQTQPEAPNIEAARPRRSRRGVHHGGGSLQPPTPHQSSGTGLSEAARSTAHRQYRLSFRRSDAQPFSAASVSSDIGTSPQLFCRLRCVRSAGHKRSEFGTCREASNDRHWIASFRKPRSTSRHSAALLRF